MASIPDFTRSLFVEGPAGSGKTTAAAQYLTQQAMENAVPLNSVLVLVPHPALGRPYSRIEQQASAQPEVVTLSGLARMAIDAFWPIAATSLDLSPEATQPSFLSADLAQYHLSRFVQPYWELGIFGSIRLPKYRVANQILDSINNAVLSGFSLDETEKRLIAAWGNRHSSRVRIYQTAMEIARQYHDFCRKNALLDYALQLHLLVNVLLDHPDFQEGFRREFRCFVAENVEEMGALAHDFIFWCTETVEKSLLIYDQNAGFRTFLGADPTNAYLLRDVCHDRIVMETTVAVSSSIQALAKEVQAFFDHPHTPRDDILKLDTQVVQVTSSAFYPQMIEHCVQQVHQLVSKESVSPSQIAIIAPYLHDSLLFALQAHLRSSGVPSIYHRPSRPLKNELSVQMMLTLFRLACPELDAPPAHEVAQALGIAISGLDPVRAALLSQTVYRQNALAAAETIAPPLVERITSAVILSYEHLRQWLNDHGPDAAAAPDHFLDQLLNSVLSQPGFGFYQNPETAHLVEEFVAAAQRFCNNAGRDQEEPIVRDFFEFAVNGFMASDWATERPNAVSIAPAHTYLTRDTIVDYQFWIDAGDSGWYERLEQPLTHPNVLRRNFPADAEWTDEMEQQAQTTSLQNVILGLLRRCRKGVFIEICDISANGYEQRGQLLLLLQQIFDGIPVARTL